MAHYCGYWFINGVLIEINMKVYYTRIYYRGIIPIYKPIGKTSNEVTCTIRDILAKALSVSKWNLKVGHGGTLDKSAEGLLIIGVGQDCKRLTNYLHGDKTYEALGCLGQATTTYDSSGMITDTKSCDHVTQESLLNVLDTFRGEQYQIPPVYSALKFKGLRASDLARLGHTIDMTTKQRLITIRDINLLNFELPKFLITVKCSSGTYIRTLVHDIGLACGTVAHVKRLYRLQQGSFTLAEALCESQWTMEHFSNFISKDNPE